MNTKFIPDDKTNADSLGDLIIYNNSGKTQEFRTTRKAFFRWYASGYSDSCLPNGVKPFREMETDVSEPANEEYEFGSGAWWNLQNW